MAIKARLQKKGNSFEKLLESVKALAKEKVKIGHFKSQGLVPETNFTFPMLMAYHHTGDPRKFIPARPVLTVVFHGSKPTTVPAVRRAMRTWGRRTTAPAAAKKLLDSIGRAYVKEIRNVFGNSAVIAANAAVTQALKGGRNTPMIDTGVTRAKVSYKTTIDNVVKRI